MNKKNTIAKISIEMIEKTQEAHACNSEVMGTGEDLLQLFGDIAQNLMHDCEVPKEVLHEIIDAAAENMVDKEEVKEEGDEIPDEVKAGLVFLHKIGVL